MRTIQQKISLEEFVSRLPSIVPAYKDNKLYFFDDKSLKSNDRQYLYTSNYGMIPINVTVSASTDGGYDFCVDSVHCYNCDCLCDDSKGKKKPCYDEFSNGMTTYSFRTISEYYHFFKDYYQLLKDYSHCKTIYSSATQYYDSELSDPRYADDLVYGTDRATYEALDEAFTNMGGKVSAATDMAFEKKNYISDVTDDGFYKFICDRIIPTYTIPTKYSEYWHRKTLYYPDVVRWMGWFSLRENYENEGNFKTDENGIEHWSCKNDNIKDCCDCEEYFNRGGARILSSMTTWYDGIQTGITELNELVKVSGSCFTPTMYQSLNLTTSLDNLGEMSILSEEYQLGKDYRIADNLSASTNTKSGTTIVYEDGSSKVLSGGCGFCFDTTYMEKVFKENDWGSYSDVYRNTNKDEFTVNYLFYAYDEDDKLITGNTESGVSASCADFYSITFIDSILINGDLYEVKKAEKGEYNGKTYFVFRDEYTNTPYTTIGDRRIYAELYPYSGDPYYYFTVFKTDKYNRKKAKRSDDRVDDIDDSFKDNNYVHFPRKVGEGDSTNPLVAKISSYIDYNGASYIVEDGASAVTINSIEYNRISGYTYDKNGEAYYILTDGSVKYSDILIEPTNKTSVSGGTLIVRFNNEPTIHSANIIVGKTTSKLDSLKSRKPLTDDIGNVLNGLLNVADKNNYHFQPKEGTELEPLYQVGNIYLGSDAQYVNTQFDQYNITGDTNYFVGNIITNMDFYYKKSDGSVDDNTMVKLCLDESGNTSGNTDARTSLSAITLSTSRKSSSDVYEPNIYCDITYYQGATLSRKKDQRYVLADGSKYNHGVEYHETVQFIKKDEQYYFKLPPKNFLPFLKNNVKNHSIFANVIVYDILQNIEEVETTSGNLIDVPIADFKTEIPIWSGETLTNSFDKYSGDTSIDEEVYPTFMEEYKLGNALMQKVDSNIFIERGNNAAFEKHIKLGEVYTLEALENYSNGWFKMMEN